MTTPAEQALLDVIAAVENKLDAAESCEIMAGKVQEWFEPERARAAFWCALFQGAAGVFREQARPRLTVVPDNPQGSG